jgi:hypothetical protein
MVDILEEAYRKTFTVCYQTSPPFSPRSLSHRFNSSAWLLGIADSDHLLLMMGPYSDLAQESTYLVQSAYSLMSSSSVAVVLPFYYGR